jgi:hypothetical protein
MLGSALDRAPHGSARALFRDERWIMDSALDT